MMIIRLRYADHIVQTGRIVLRNFFFNAPNRAENYTLSPENSLSVYTYYFDAHFLHWNASEGLNGIWAFLRCENDVFNPST